MASRTELTDGFVLLRPIEEQYLEGYCEAVGESFTEVSQWIGMSSAEPSREAIRKWMISLVDRWEQGATYYFGIFDARDGCYLGNCYLTDVHAPLKRANLGYWVRTSRTKHGVATAAVRLLASFGLEELGLQRIEISMATGNKASQRVAEKSGAKLEGALRNGSVVFDRVYDAFLYSIIPSDALYNARRDR